VVSRAPGVESRVVRVVSVDDFAASVADFVADFAPSVADFDVSAADFDVLSLLEASVADLAASVADLLASLVVEDGVEEGAVGTVCVFAASLLGVGGVTWAQTPPMKQTAPPMAATAEI
jgi:hypothetical protein